MALLEEPMARMDVSLRTAQTKSLLKLAGEGGRESQRERGGIGKKEQRRGDADARRHMPCI
jgi:hypothetical protein